MVTGAYQKENFTHVVGLLVKTWFCGAVCTSEKPRALRKAGGRCCLKWTIFYFSWEIPELILWHEHLNRVTRFPLHNWNTFTHSSFPALSNKMVNNFISRLILVPFFTLTSLNEQFAWSSSALAKCVLIVCSKCLCIILQGFDSSLLWQWTI